VLVVEDESVFAQALQDGLAAHGFRVDVANTGRVGLELAGAAAYDVIVLDLMLPEVNGFRVCAELRAGGDDTPILVLTAKVGEYDETEALDTGADDFISKPCSLAVLISHVRALLRRRSRQHPPVLMAGDLTLDTVAHGCARAGVEVVLTAREFALLELLMRRAGETIRKRELLDEVWDFAFDGDSNIVEVYIGYLRRKIDVPFGRDSIQTVRGVGYRLDPGGGQ